jgi:hypothetical protein
VTDQRIVLVGAFDRFNFGDLLFPAVTCWALHSLGVAAHFEHAALRAADLSARGGVVTGALDQLERDPLPPGSAAVLAGGEVLAARWLDARLALVAPARSLRLKLLTRLLGRELMDRRSHSALGGDRPLPWVLAPADLGHGVRVAYNAVGGVGLTALPEELQRAARHRLSAADYLSVRDPEAQQALDSWKLAREVHLAPDPAALVAEVFPRRRLEEERSATVAHTLARVGPSYAVVQAGRYPTLGRVRTLAGQLRRLHRASGLALVLLPLGQAAGHDDRVPLTRLAELLAEVPTVLVDEPTVTDILDLIAGARLFLGTSLHGNLTALAYDVPRVGFGDRVAKLDWFLQTWDPLQATGTIPCGQIARAAERALEAGGDELRTSRQTLSSASWDNYRRLAAAIAG